MPTEVLTDAYVRNLKPKPKRQEVTDEKTPGLRIRVSPKGRKTWLYEKRVKRGLKRKHHLGEYPHVSIKDARSVALSIKVEADAGIDRIEEREKEVARREAEKREEKSLRDLLGTYYQVHARHLKSGDHVMSTLWRGLDSSLDLPARSITQPLLQNAVDEFAKSAPVQANRLRAFILHFTKFCRLRGYFPGDFVVELSKATRETSRDVVLSVGEVQSIYNASFGLGDLWGPLVRLMILTAQRESEIAHLVWPEVLIDKRLLNLGAARTKNGVGHLTHLSEPAFEEISWLSAWRDDDIDWVFTTTDDTPVSGFSKMKKRLDKLLGSRVQPWRLHDLRTAFATTMAEAGEDEGVVDRILNHQASSSSPSVVARIYNRALKLEQRQQVLDRWGKLVTGAEKHSAQIVRVA